MAQLIKTKQRLNPTCTEARAEHERFRTNRTQVAKLIKLRKFESTIIYDYKKINARKHSACSYVINEPEFFMAIAGRIYQKQIERERERHESRSKSIQFYSIYFYKIMSKLPCLICT